MADNQKGACSTDEKRVNFLELIKQREWEEENSKKPRLIWTEMGVVIARSYNEFAEEKLLKLDLFEGNCGVIYTWPLKWLTEISSFDFCQKFIIIKDRIGETKIISSVCDDSTIRQKEHLSFYQDPEITREEGEAIEKILKDSGKKTSIPYFKKEILFNKETFKKLPHNHSELRPLFPEFETWREIGGGQLNFSYVYEDYHWKIKVKIRNSSASFGKEPDREKTKEMIESLFSDFSKDKVEIRVVIE